MPQRLLHHRQGFFGTSVARVIRPLSVRFYCPARRRVAALFALLCVLAMAFERFAPDEHVVDHNAAELVVGAGDQGHAAATPSGAPAEHVPLPSHSGHVDHCTHVHLVGLIGAPASGNPRVWHASVPDTPSQRLPSVSSPPRQRPPIA